MNMSFWKTGKILWYDRISEEGLVVDQENNTFYLHKAAILEKNLQLHDNSKVKFTLYNNGYLFQIDKIKAS